MYVICPICKFHPSSLTPILSPYKLQLPPPLVLFLFLCKMRREQLSLVFCNQLELIWLQFLRLPVCSYSSWASSKHAHGGSEDLVSFTLSRGAWYCHWDTLWLAVSVVSFSLNWWKFFFILKLNSMFFTNSQCKPNIILCVKKLTLEFFYYLAHLLCQL